MGFIRANYLALFPKLIDQNQFNRRARALRLLVDTKPIPVMGYKHNKSHSDFAGSANYGRCASRNLKYFGYKLVTVSTLDGILIVYDLVPANTDKRKATETVIDPFLVLRFLR